MPGDAEELKRLGEQDHRALALWAADCAAHVLPYFEEKHPEDDRPRRALEAGRAWARGEITVSEARAAAFAAHAAARDVEDRAARAAARAAGHAAATAHVAGHARHAAAYAVTAATRPVADPARNVIGSAIFLARPERLWAGPDGARRTAHPAGRKAGSRSR